ncbi:hypothetical protein H6F67_21245 [Microcoleus sp. FACHB-1515]|uniref:hypothetical protein n=1 Tax=Cyanophyceae TaxID=3028117 RepID=UPI00168459AE|nr:hypothetical protein [Microcoleus sp. FACHB-1515]MBD2092379.1 hypothetical protein [Microcoleus sp. FACHB-1515]
MWQFDSELSLEAFVNVHLLTLLDLSPLARQFFINSQVCDILAVSPQRQLTILELKNTEDRYIVQQLTRYYSAILTHKPFADQVDYSLPIRLVAVAPNFHAHNFIDRQYSQLLFEFFIFEVQSQSEQFQFCLTQPDGSLIRCIDIPSAFHATLMNMALPAPIEVERKLPPPPKSLRQLVETLAPTEQDYVLQLRQQMLMFSDQMQEVGRTTSTQYGLRKGEKDLYKTKLCAQFVPFYSGSDRPCLMLQLPYPKKEFGAPGRRFKPERVKGLTWTQVSHQKDLWNCTAPIQLFSYLGKTRNYHSYSYDLNTYAQMYFDLTGQERKLRSIADVVDLALGEWQQNLTTAK